MSGLEANHEINVDLSAVSLLTASFGGKAERASFQLVSRKIPIFNEGEVYESSGQNLKMLFRLLRPFSLQLLKALYSDGGISFHKTWIGRIAVRPLHLH